MTTIPTGLTPKQALISAIAVSTLSVALVGFYALSKISRLENTVSAQADILTKYEAAVKTQQSIFAGQAETQRTITVLQGETKAASLSLAQETAKFEGLKQTVQAAVASQREALAKIEAAKKEFQQHIQNVVLDRKNMMESVQGLAGEIVTEMNRVRSRPEIIEEAHAARNKNVVAPQSK